MACSPRPRLPAGHCADGLRGHAALARCRRAYARVACPATGPVLCWFCTALCAPTPLRVLTAGKARASALRTALGAQEMDGLKQVVGSRSSVPKELVYPRFDALAKLWLAFEEEAQMLRVRRQTLDTLYLFRASFLPRLKSEDVSAARAARRAAAAAEAEGGGAAEGGVRSGGARSLRSAGGAAGGGAGGVGGRGGVGAEGGGGSADGGRRLGGDGLAPDDDRAERIPADFAPSMLQLSLELEGYCPVTLVDKGGLLLPGSAECIVRYRSRYYACVDEAAASAFVAAPAKYVQGILAQATRSPELIHLLRLQEHFPSASISEALTRQARQRPPLSADEALLGPQPKQMLDSQVQTQVHLVDKHIDVNYEFSEWALRRRALQLANIRNKATKSAQTAKSHFRKEIQTQVGASKQAARSGCGSVRRQSARLCSERATRPWERCAAGCCGVVQLPLCCVLLLPTGWRQAARKSSQVLMAPVHAGGRACMASVFSRFLSPPL